jgi:hypothetical protein
MKLIRSPVAEEKADGEESKKPKEEAPPPITKQTTDLKGKGTAKNPSTHDITKDNKPKISREELNSIYHVKLGF